MLNQCLKQGTAPEKAGGLMELSIINLPVEPKIQNPTMLNSLGIIALIYLLIEIGRAHV